MPSAAGRAYDVLMLGYFGFGNLGDELLASASAGFLGECGVPAERVAILSNAPAGSEARIGVSAFDRWRLAAVASAIRSSRSLLLAGGGLFQDSSSAKSAMYYWGVVRIAAALSCPVWALGQSIGPLRCAVSSFFAKNALSCCRYLAVRDKPSFDIARGFGLFPDIMPDIVMGMRFPETGKSDGRRALINARPETGEGAAVLARAALACSSVGFSLVGIAFSEEDVRALEAIRDEKSVPLGEICLVASAGDFADVAKCASVSIGMRLHFAILSVKAGIMTSMWPYDPKVAAFADEWGLTLLNSDICEKNLSDFVIMTLLTNARFQDKKKGVEFGPLVAEHFKKGLSLVLGGSTRER
ncbi:MAG: polysaccharide pyruvyl transferase family protein [Synergistaceae bacterium]|jgi:polysaccharide pyruvyl transferase CsaB|nr:polysaccharide pyruvyl transferase family protein [Synergistaceae bacterium]